MALLALTLQLLLAAGDRCYFVSNTRIRVLPTCDISPATIDELTEDPAPVQAGNVQLQGMVPRSRWYRGTAPWGRPAVVGNEELERRLEIAEQQRITAVAQRLSAEQERDAALRERDAALRERDAARHRLATIRKGSEALQDPVRRTEHASRSSRAAVLAR